MESPDLRARLVAATTALAPTPGRHPTPLPDLFCFRACAPTPLEPGVYAPSICFIAQGAKEAAVGSRILRYDPLRYLVVGAAMPVRSHVVAASTRAPLLSVILGVRAADVRELIVEMEAGDGAGPQRWNGEPPLRVTAMDDRLLGAVVRLLESLSDPLDRQILARAAWREVLYLVLRGEQGELLRLASRRDGRSPGVARALHHIHRNLEKRLDLATLARAAGMSVSSLHHRFKEATTLSPKQYVKSLRLDRARQMMVDDGVQAAEAAFRVGYESPSQFSRELKRWFGASPRQYLAATAGNGTATARRPAAPAPVARRL